MLGTVYFRWIPFIALVMIWGSAFAVIKVGLEYSPPVLFAGVRTLIGGLAMMVMAALWGGRLDLYHTWPALLLSAGLNGVLFILFQTLAVLHLSSGLAAVLIYLQPILVGILAWVWLEEPFSLTKVGGLVLGFAGVVAVSVESSVGVVSGLGVVFGVVAAFSWAIGTVYFKRIQSKVSILWLIAVQFVVGGLILSAFGVSLESLSAIEWWEPPFLFSLLYTSLIGVMVAWILWLGLIRAGEASRVAAYTFVVPLVSVIVGTIFLHESTSLVQMIGGGLIVLGVYLVNRRRRARK